MKFTTEQQVVIDSPATRIACQAVPGSGKTATMVARIVRMIGEETIDSRRTAVVTLTNAAANEFTERLKESGVDVEAVGYIGTIHGLALATIRYHGDRVAMISEQLGDQFLDEIIKKMSLKTTRNKIRKDFGTFHERNDNQIGAVAYRARLESLGAMEVSFLIGLATMILAAAGDAAFGQDDGFNALFVDEFQDTSEADYKFLSALRPEHFFVIGDLNQAIFGFRGASPENFDAFIDGSPMIKHGGLMLSAPTPLFRLTGSFRCSPAISEAASNLFDPKVVSLNTAWARPGKLDGIRYSTPALELEGILEMFIESPDPQASFAILCRYSRQVTAITSLLKASGIPVKTPEPAPPGYRQAIAAAQLMLGHGVGIDQANDLGRLEYEAAFGVSTAGMSIDIPVLGGGQTVYQALLACKVPEDAARWFFRLFGDSESLDHGLDRVIVTAMCELQQSILPGGDGLTVCTIHEAKGREWDHVVIPAMEELTMPGFQASAERIEEEKRVFYVAITRARLSVTCTFCDTRDRQFSNGALEPTAPSRFLKEAGII